MTRAPGRRIAQLGATVVTALVLAVHVPTWIPAARALAGSSWLPPVQSLVILAVAGAMMAVSGLRYRRHRAAVAAVVLLGAFTLMWLMPLAFEHVGQNFMGDGQDFAGHREKFEINIPLAGGTPELHLKAHLGDALLALFDRAFGPSQASPGLAYQVVSRLGGFLFLAEIGTVLLVLRASPRACRFAALALAAPVVVGFFGYYELGYLAVSAAAFPLLVLGIRARRVRLECAGAALQGLHAAFHGFGLLGIAGSMLAAATIARGRWRMASVPLRVGAIAAVAYLGWIVVYRVGFGVAVVPDPASSNIAFRSVDTLFYFDRRLVHPLNTFNGLAEVGMTSLAVGVPALVLAAARARGINGIAPALAYAAPGLVFLVVWWPTMGVSRDMDLLLGAFGGVFAAAWVCSRRRSDALAALGVLAAVHLLFWAAVADRSLARVWLGE